MASAMLLYLKNLWPFSMLKSDDLRLSSQLIRRLSLPEQTKQFVFAVHEPDSNAVVYILAAQNLSQQSALDAESLIREVQPKAVVAQVASSALTEIQVEEKSCRDDPAIQIPTSSIGVLKRCLTDKVNKEQYDKFAGCQVLREIFGIGFYGHFLAAKRAAEEVNSCFILLESPYENASNGQSPGSAGSSEKRSGLNLQQCYFLPGRIAPAVYMNSRRFCLTDTHQAQMVKSLVPSLELSLQKTNLSNSTSEVKSDESDPVHDNYEPPPPFAQSVYPLLADLHSIFNDLTGIRRALRSAQKMLADVHKGEPVVAQLLYEVHNFRIAVEGLRIALNNAGLRPIKKLENGKSGTKLDFSELSSDEKCHVLFAQSLRRQARKFGGSVVAIVDARCLAGLRRQWTTSVPPQIADLADQCFTVHCFDGHLSEEGQGIAIEHHSGRKGMLTDKPMVAVGAGATAVLGATALSKTVPASTLVKVATYKVPAVLKFGLACLKRQACMGLNTILGPSKLLAPGVASAGAKTSTTLKLTASAEKIRVATHSMIAYAERTSLLAIRTSFYEIMRRRRVGSLRLAPWVTFGCSLVACSGLVKYGDGIECAAESIPSVPTIASLGRGLESLQQASQEVRQRSSMKIQEALQPLVYSLKKK